MRMSSELNQKPLKPMDIETNTASKIENIMETMSIAQYHKDLFNAMKYPLIVYGIIASIYAAYLPGTLIWFSWHPFFMIISFIMITSNAILIKKIGGYDNTKYHSYMMLAVVCFASFAWYVIYSNKEMLGKLHFVSIHGKLGCTVMVSYFCVGLLGAIGLHPDWGVVRTNKLLRSIHKWLGRISTIAAWFCCTLGISTVSF